MRRKVINRIEYSLIYPFITSVMRIEKRARKASTTVGRDLVARIYINEIDIKSTFPPIQTLYKRASSRQEVVVRLIPTITLLEVS